MAAVCFQSRHPFFRPARARPGATSPKDSQGFTLIEVLIVVAVIGILSVTVIPFFINFLQAERARGAARQVAALLNQARQLAISRNTSYRVEVDTANNRLRFVRTSDNAAWTGPGTDSNGYVKLAGDASIACSNTNPVFNSLGAATPAATLRVQDTQAAAQLYVTVSASGRIKSESTGTCP